MTRNGGFATGRLDPDAVATAVSDAVADHEDWLGDWQRAMACGLPPGEAVLAEAAYRNCRFGRWMERNSGGGGPDDSLLGDLHNAHRNMHEAVRLAAGGRRSTGPVGCAEYDAAIAAADVFRRAARRMMDACGPAQDDSVPIDPLIDLQGRLTMLGELERERDRALRTGTPMSLMMVRPQGIDELERAHGRAGLDRVVAGFATRLFGLLRPYDGIYRYGRCCFVVCLPGTTANQAVGIARRVFDAISSAVIALPDDTEVSIPAGFGIAVIEPRRTVQETLEHAVQAAGLAGAAGKDTVVVWTGEPEA